MCSNGYRQKEKKSYYCGFQTESLRRDSHGPWAASAANTWWHGRPVTVTRLIVSASVPRAWVPLLAPQRLLRSTFSAKKNPETALTSSCTRPSCPSSRGPTLPLPVHAPTRRRALSLSVFFSAPLQMNPTRPPFASIPTQPPHFPQRLETHLILEHFLPDPSASALPLKSSASEKQIARPMDAAPSSPSSPSSLKDKLRTTVCSCFGGGVAGAAGGERVKWRRRAAVEDFRYDSLSYALNFDEGEDDDAAAAGFRYRNFNSRLPPSPAQ
jgi:hypothetical protein